MLTRRATLAGFAALAFRHALSAELSEPHHHHRGALPARRTDRRAGAPDRAGSGGRSQATDRGREPPRRLGHHRHRRGGARRARRLHADPRHEPDPRHQPEPDQELHLRRGEGFRAGRRHRRDAARAGGAQELRRRRASATWSRWRRPSPARSPSARWATAPARIWLANCSRPRPASTCCMCRSRGWRR